MGSRYRRYREELSFFRRHPPGATRHGLKPSLEVDTELLRLELELGFSSRSDVAGRRVVSPWVKA